jgi:hypothetical protein
MSRRIEIGNSLKDRKGRKKEEGRRKKKNENENELKEFTKYN